MPTSALRENGTQFAVQSSVPGTPSATNPIIYFDNTTTAPRLMIANGSGTYDISGKVYDVNAYGGDPTGTNDSTAAFQAAMTAALAVGGVVVIPPGTWKCGQINDTTANRLEIIGCTGATIRTTASTWLKVAPTAGKTAGVVLRNLRLQPLSGNAVMQPLIWLEGTGTGGITAFDLSDIAFTGGGSASAPVYFDCIWLRGCFNGSVRDIWGGSLYGSRGIIHECNGINSGNTHLDSIILPDAVVGFLHSGSGGTPAAPVTSYLNNQLIATNFKCFRTATASDAAPYNEVTLTAGASANVGTLTVSVPDATTINANLTAVPPKPQWAVLGDVSNFDDVVQITAANTGTGVLTLARNTRYSMANGTVIGVGVFGAVLGGNSRGVQINSMHNEQIGVSIYCSASQQSNFWNSYLGATNCKIGVVCTNGSQNTKAIHPLISSSGSPSLIVMKVTAQGTNTNNFLFAPADINFSTPTSYLTDANAASFNNRYFPLEGQFQLDGLAATQVPVLDLQNTTASTVGVPVQSGPGVASDGTAWNTIALASQKSRALLVNSPASGNPVVTGLEYWSSENGSAFARWLRMDSAGLTRLYRASGAATLILQSSGVDTLQIDAAPEIFPTTNNTGFIGTSSKPFANAWFSRYMNTPQTIAAAASITINPAAGGKVRINLSATAITALTISAGNDSEEMTVLVAQDATGGRAIPTTWTNVRFAGGTYTATATLNKIDALTFKYDATAAAWIEKSRSLNT